jgi:hypothetical protein
MSYISHWTKQEAFPFLSTGSKEMGVVPLLLITERQALYFQPQYFFIHNRFSVPLVEP